MKECHYTTIDHTGDVGIEWEGADLPELFRGGAFAFAHLVVGDGAGRRGDLSVEVDLDAIDLPDLLVRFLQELLFRFETRGELLTGLSDVAIDPGDDGRARFRGTLAGRSFDLAVEEVHLVIKAVTYHALEVEQLPDGSFHARVIFDV